VLYKLTSIYKQNAQALLGGFRRALNEGGTSSSKTISILQILILVAQHTKENLLISVVSESLPHLKRGCLRDFQNILGETFDYSKYNKTEHIYDFGKGKIEFFPADEPSKMRGGRRDILFINECNNVSYDAFKELDIRTRLFTFLDWNPVSEFWAHEKGMINDPVNSYIFSTYKELSGSSMNR
jgi:phage terminase large subunit